MTFHRIRVTTPPAQPASAPGTQAHSLLVCGWWAEGAFYVFKWLGGSPKKNSIFCDTWQLEEIQSSVSTPEIRLENRHVRSSANHLRLLVPQQGRTALKYLLWGPSWKPLLPAPAPPPRQGTRTCLWPESSVSPRQTLSECRQQPHGPHPNAGKH